MPTSRRIKPGTAVAVRQTILWTGVFAVIPLLLYPRTFGLGQLGLNPAIALLEWLVYFVAFLFIVPSLRATQRLLAAGLTVVYRLCCAVLFAALAAFNNDYGFVDTLAVAMWSYPFTVLLHFIVAPFVLKPVWTLAFAPPAPRARFAMSHGVSAAERSRTTPRTASRPVMPLASAPSAASISVPESGPDFDDAVTYVGEYAGVRMCWLVDNDGLPLAFWQRQGYTGAVEFWAPITVEIVDFDRRCLSVGGEVEPQRVEIRTSAGRLIIESADDYWLGVLTDHEADDLVGVRLAQARDMVLKQIQRRRNSYAVLQEV